MEKDLLDLLDKISSVLLDLNERLKKVEPFTESEYCNKVISDIQKKIVALEKE